MRIQAGVALKGLGVAQQLGRPASEERLAQVAGQLHAGAEIIARAIPLDERELRVVQRALLFLAEDAADLVDGLGPGRQEPLHGELRRGLQPEGPRLSAGRADVERKRIEVPIDDRIGREDRRFHFQEAAVVEELAKLPQQAGPQAQVLPGGGGEVVGGQEWAGPLPGHRRTQSADT